MRKSFILHNDSLNVLDILTDEQAGKLFKAIRNYQNGVPQELDFGINIAFVQFENQFKRDEEKYESVVERNKINGSKGGRPKNPTEPKETQNNPVGLLETQNNPTEPKKADSDSDSKNDSDSDSGSGSKKEIDIIPKKQKKVVSEFDKQIRSEGKQFFLNCYQSKTGSEFCWAVKDSSALIALLDKVKAKVREKFPEIENESAEFKEKLISGFQIILTNIKDKWILDNYTIPIINSKFNEIYSQITTKKHDTNNLTDLVNFAVGANQ
jgi:hypothetical protein